MRIGELARLSGVRPATLRYYEGRGLLSRPSRTEAGYRSYTPESAAQLRLIRWAKGLGFTLREIREMTGAIGQHAVGRGDRVRSQVQAKIAEVDAKYALFTELGYGLDRQYPAPDFHCVGLRADFFVEATTVNPSAQAPIISETNRKSYFSHYVPIKYGSALFSKLQKRYWELPHVQGHPLLLAVQDFHAPQAMTWSNTALVEYLYGVRQLA
jgi:DNA-binding transcriptional MerR regulator